VADERVERMFAELLEKLTEGPETGALVKDST
jgi:hypothetical protein